MLGQVEPTVDQGPAPGGGQGEEHADPSVLDASGGARVLPLHSRRGPALLQETGLVDDENSIVGAEVFGGVVTQVVADRIGVSSGVPHQTLQGPGPLMPRSFGQLPAVLPLDARR